MGISLGGIATSGKPSAAGVRPVGLPASATTRSQDSAGRSLVQAAPPPAAPTLDIEAITSRVLSAAQAQMKARMAIVNEAPPPPADAAQPTYAQILARAAYMLSDPAQAGSSPTDTAMLT